MELMHWHMPVYLTIKKQLRTGWLNKISVSGFHRFNLIMTPCMYEDQRIVTSAGTGAALDCCLYLVREIYNARIANKVSKSNGDPASP